MKKILVIDDDIAILDVIKVVLEEAGFEVLTDPAGVYFENKKNILPDLVLLDVLLGGKSGGNICKQIKNNPKTKNIPVIIISANATAEVEQVKEESGADGFITKPFDIYYLVDKVKKHLK